MEFREDVFAEGFDGFAGDDFAADDGLDDDLCGDVRMDGQRGKRGKGWVGLGTYRTFDGRRAL